ncbi:MAG: sensor histidine kinase [Rhodanobacteraceae bacterium]
MIFKHSHSDNSPGRFDFLHARGELARLIREKDWSKNPLGAAERWPRTLKVALAICLNSKFATYVWWGEDLIQLYNDAAVGHLRRKHPGCLGVPARQCWSEVWPETGPLVERVLATGEAVREENFEVVPKRDKTLDSAWFTFGCTPLRDEGSNIAGLFITSIETTEQMRAAAALQASEARLHAIIQSATEYAIVTLDAQGRITSWNSGAESVLGYSEEEAIGQPGEIFFTPEDRASELPAIEMTLAREEGRASDERWHVRKDGSLFWGSGVMLPVEGHKRDRYLKIFRDSTRERLAQQRQEFLTEELNHRVKNTMAIVQSVAMQTLRQSATVEEAREALESRLVALGRAHDILVATNWRGGDLRETIEGVLRMILDEALGTRVHLHGPDIHLEPGPLLGLTLALHELATNAIKHGAMSNAGGRIEIRWEITEDTLRCFRLRWVERDGPPVEPPRKRGFGSRVIEEGLAHEFDGRVELKFAREGLECTIRAPLREITGER